MKLIAKFVKSLDVVSGETDRGSWQRGGMVVRTFGDNEKLVAITAFGAEKVVLTQQFRIDDIVEVDFIPESREFDGRWFTDLRLIRVKLLGQNPDEARKGGDE